MAQASVGVMDAHSGDGANSRHDQILFWGCFIALITTAFGFIARMFLINTWATEFGLDPAQSGRLAGIGIWPFAVSIIGFSLIIDRIGYKVAMIMAFLGHIIWAIIGVSAYFTSQGGNKEGAFQMLYWGSLLLGLANGTVEAFINPVVATMFSREKTKWLNILHAGWPGGLVVAGMVTIFLAGVPWWVKVGLIAIPAVIYFLMLIPLKFPVQERVASGVTYRDMLAEFGILGALVVGFLVVLQLMNFFESSPAFQAADGTLAGWAKILFIVIGLVIVGAFAAYTKSLGRPFMFFMILIMMPLATTEIGTDGWITAIMEKAVTFNAGWILVYTSIIMVVLRFFAGPIIKALTPLGLLMFSSALAIAGLFFLSKSVGVGMIFIAATLYGFGKTFFWPTMLGVVSEQTPKGGALTLNAISGIGMLAVGVLGFPYIGTLQANKNIEAVTAAEQSKKIPGLLAGDTLTVLDDKSIYEILKYKAINDAHLHELLSAGRLFPSEAGQYEKKQEEKKFDKNKDGKLDAEEQKAMEWDPKKEFDKNGDGKLDAEEQKEMDWAPLKKYDKNKDGKLDDAEKKEMADEWFMEWGSRWDTADKDGKKDKKLSDAEKAKMASDEAQRKAEWLTRFDADKSGSLSDTEYTAAREHGEKIVTARDRSTQGALKNMTIFPLVMLIGYIILVVYFQSKGGYKPLVLGDH